MGRVKEGRRRQRSGEERESRESAGKVEWYLMFLS